MVVRWLLWAAVVGVSVGVGEAKGEMGTDRCKESCSAVPEDLWPYCCEKHHTCCKEFAHSCMHDCLPRIHTGDVSMVEERPGLCCALYNLCCFRETMRISSIRKPGKQKPASFPIVHRFHTGLPQAQKPIIMSGLVTRPLRRKPVQPPSNNKAREGPRQESTPKRPNPFRPQKPKKPGSPERPQALTKTSSNAEDRNNPSGGKLLVRESLQELRKVTTADDDRRVTLTEIKNTKTRPKVSLGLISRKAEEEPTNNPRELLGPRRPFKRPATLAGQQAGKSETREGRTGSSRPKVTKRLRRPIQGAEDQRQGGRQRFTQGGRQRLATGRSRADQQGSIERPQQATRQGPNQQAGSGREEQTRKQANDARRAGRTQSPDERATVTQTSIDQTQGRTTNVQDIEAAGLKLEQTPKKNENTVNVAEVATESTIQLPVTPESTLHVMIEDKQSDIVEKLEQTETDVNIEMEMTEKVIDKMMERDQMQGTITKQPQSTDDMIDEQAKDMEKMQDESVAGTNNPTSPTLLSQEPEVTITKTEMITNADKEEVTVKPTRTRTESNSEGSESATASQTRSSSGRTRTRGNQGTSEASQARTSSRTSQTRSRSGSERQTRGRGRAQTRETTSRSNRGETRTRSSTRGRATQTRSETGKRTQVRQSSRLATQTGRISNRRQ